MPRNMSRSVKIRKAAGGQLDGVVRGAVRHFSYPSRVRSLTAVSTPSLPKSKSAMHAASSAFHYRNESMVGGVSGVESASGQQLWPSTEASTSPALYSDGVDGHAPGVASFNDGVANVAVMPESQSQPHTALHPVLHEEESKPSILSVPDPVPHATPSIGVGRSADAMVSTDMIRQGDAAGSESLGDTAAEPDHKAVFQQPIASTKRPQRVDIKKAESAGNLQQASELKIEGKAASSDVSPVKQVLNWIAADPAWHSESKDNGLPQQGENQNKHAKAEPSPVSRTQDKERLVAIAKHLSKVSKVTNIDQLNLTDSSPVKREPAIKAQSKMSTPQPIRVAGVPRKSRGVVQKSARPQAVVTPKTAINSPHRAYRNAGASTSTAKQSAASQSLAVQASQQRQAPRTKIIREVVTVRQQTPRSSRPTRGFIQRSHLTQMLWRRIR